MSALIAKAAHAHLICRRAADGRIGIWHLREAGWHRKPWARTTREAYVGLCRARQPSTARRATSRLWPALLLASACAAALAAGGCTPGWTLQSNCSAGDVASCRELNYRQNIMAGAMMGGAIGGNVGAAFDQPRGVVCTTYYYGRVTQCR